MTFRVIFTQTGPHPFWSTTWLFQLNGSVPGVVLTQPAPSMGAGQLPVVHSSKEPRRAGPHEQLWWEGGLAGKSPG